VPVSARPSRLVPHPGEAVAAADERSVGAMPG
jgi:hypothetical protein